MMRSGPLDEPKLAMTFRYFCPWTMYSSVLVFAPAAVNSLRMESAARSRF